MRFVKCCYHISLLLACTAAATGDADCERWPLIYAAGEGDSETVRALLAAGHPVGETSRDGETALHVAGIRGDVLTVEALIKAGADVNARTPAGATLQMTPLHWAIYHGHTEMVRRLLDAGADPAAPNEHGKTPLQMCDEVGQAPSAELIRKAILSAGDRGDEHIGEKGRGSERGASKEEV
jgi:ankyrin repeat protein